MPECMLQNRVRNRSLQNANSRKKHLKKWNMTLVNKKSTKNVTKYLFSRKIKFKTCFGHILCSLSVTDDHRPPKVLHAKRFNSWPPDE